MGEIFGAEMKLFGYGEVIVKYRIAIIFPPGGLFSSFYEHVLLAV